MYYVKGLLFMLGLPTFIMVLFWFAGTNSKFASVAGTLLIAGVFLLIPILMLSGIEGGDGE